MSILLEDYNDIENGEVRLVEEREHGEKSYYLRGVMSWVNKLNKNKRIYTEEVMTEAIKSVYDSIRNNGMVGELDHPPTPRVNMDRISHLVTNLEMSPNGAVLGEIKALDTPQGKILKTLMESKIRLGVSTRAVGGTRPYMGPLSAMGEGVVEVLPGLKLITIDVVHDPSAGTYPNAIIESADNVMLGQTIKFKQVWENVFGR